MDKINSQQLLTHMQKMIEAANGTKPDQQVINGADFKTALSNALSEVNSLQMEAGALTKKFEQGDPNVDLSDVMIAMQKSTVAFEATLQVRNRVVAAYQEIMNMPI